MFVRLIARVLLRHSLVDVARLDGYALIRVARYALLCVRQKEGCKGLDQ